MTLTMADGPVENLPTGFDAYAGYVNRSGIGATYAGVVQRFPNAIHFSITTNGSDAQCADVESGAMGDWRGYQYGYCDIANAQRNINTYGRPPKLWTAHHNNVPHICSPACGFGFTGNADGTQWADPGPYDESLLLDNFFDLTPPPPTGENMAQTAVFNFKPNQLDVIQISDGSIWHKWNQGTSWSNEAIGVAGVTYTGQPQVAVLGGAAWVTAEDSTGRAWTFVQTSTESTWSNSELP